VSQVSRSTRVPPPWLAALALVWALPACAGGDVAELEGEPTAARPDEADAGVPCRIVASAENDESCREDWACEGTGVRSVVCSTTKSGVACVCWDTEEVTKVFETAGLDCQLPGGNLTWFETCGWSMTP